MTSSLSSDAEYRAALDRIYALMDVARGDPEEGELDALLAEGGELDALLAAVEDYEAKHFPMEAGA